MECLHVYDARAPYFPAVCLVCSREQGLHTLVRVIYWVPHTLTPIIQTYSGKAIGCTLPPFSTTLLGPRTLLLVSEVECVCVCVCVYLCVQLRFIGRFQRGMLFRLNTQTLPTFALTFCTRADKRQHESVEKDAGGSCNESQRSWEHIEKKLTERGVERKCVGGPDPRCGQSGITQG